MNIKVINFLGEEAVYTNVMDLRFAYNGYRFEIIKGRDISIVNRPCSKFSVDVLQDEYNFIITEW